jgi:hypothetical protein
VIESEHLKKIFLLLYPHVKTPSGDTIRNEIMSAFKEKRNKIQNILQVFIYTYFCAIILLTLIIFKI